MDSLLLKELYHNQNLSQRDIAKKMRMTQSSVGYWIKKHGLTADDALMAKKMAIRAEKLTKHPISLTRDELERLFVTEGRQQKEIAEMCGVPRASITRAVKMFGLSLTLEQQGKRLGDCKRGKESPLKGTFADEPLMTKEHLECLYVREKMTQTQIAKLFGVTQGTIQYYVLSRGLRQSSDSVDTKPIVAKRAKSLLKIKCRIMPPSMKEFRDAVEGGLSNSELKIKFNATTYYLACWKKKFGWTRKQGLARGGKSRIRHRGDKPVLDAYGYVTVSAPDHPGAHHNGRVPMHILVAEKMLGRPLKKKVEEVHHINADKADYREENLAVLGKTQHRRVHHYYERVGRYYVGLSSKPSPMIFDPPVLWGGRYITELDLTVQPGTTRLIE